VFNKFLKRCNRLSADLFFKTEYDLFMTDMIERGFAERVPVEELLLLLSSGQTSPALPGEGDFQPLVGRARGGCDEVSTAHGGRWWYRCSMEGR